MYGLQHIRCNLYNGYPELVIVQAAIGCYIPCICATVQLALVVFLQLAQCDGGLVLVQLSCLLVCVV